MIDITKKYRTRDGREVRIYATDGGDTYPVHGAVLIKNEDEPHYWEINTWSEGGSFDHLNKTSSELDLIEVKPRIKREVWVNVYEGEQQAMSWLFINRNLADSAAASCKEARIACVRLTIDCEEGEGL